MGALLIALCVVPLIACKPTPPEAARFADWFDRDDAATLGESWTGQPWTDLANPIGIVDEMATGGAGWSLSTADSGGSNGTVIVVAVEPGEEFWLVLRATDASNYWRFGRWQSGDYQLQQIVGNQVGSPELATMNTVTPGVRDWIECRLTDAALGCSVNGVPVVSTTDGFNSEATQVGLATWSSSGPSATRLDGLMVFDDVVEPAFPEPDPDTPVPDGARVADRFPRNDAATLGTAETGQVWTDLSNGFRVESKQAAGGGGYSLSTIDTGGATGDVQVTVAEPGEEHWLVLRASDAGNYWRFGRWQGGAYQLQQIIGNQVGTPEIVHLANVVPAAGDHVTCGLSPTSITCSVNGTTVASSADSFNSTATTIGLASWSSSGSAATRFDDLFVTDLEDSTDVGVVVTDVDPAFVGETVEWTVVVANLGTLPVADVTTALQVPAGVTGAQATPTVGTCVGVASCALGTLAPGATATVEVTGVAPATPGSISFTASLAGGDDDPANDSDTETTTVRERPAADARVIDEFDRTDSTLGSTDTGEEWTTTGGSVSTFGGTAGTTTATPTFSVVDAGWSFGTVDLTVATVGDRKFSAVFRAVDSDNYFRVGPDSTGAYELQKVIDGVAQSTQFITYRTSITAQDGDTIRIITRPDDGIFVSVNGQHLLDAGDVALMNEGRFGFTTTSASVRIDRIEVGQVMTTGVEVTDSFTRVDSSSLGGPETGVSYQWIGNFAVQSNVARYLLGHYGLTVVDVSSELTDVAVTVPQISNEYTLVFRYSEDQSYYRFGLLGDGGGYGVDYVAEGSNQVPPVPVEVVSSPIPANGDRLEVRQYLDGRVEGYVNGALVVRFTDTTTNARTTYVGFSTGGTSADFDDFHVASK